VSDKLANFSAMAMDGGHLYLGNSYNSTDVFAVPKSGGPLRKVGSGATPPKRIAVDRRYVYWATGGSLDVGDYRNAAVLRAPKRGGPTEEVVGAGKIKRVTGLIVDNWCVYWSEGEVQRAGPGKPPVPGKIGCVSKDGQRTFPVPPARNPTVLLADQSHLYWLSNVGGRTSLFMAQKRTTRATPIRKARPDIVTLDHDSTHFYWIRRTGALERLAKSGGRVETLGNAPGRALAVGPTGPLVASGEQTCSIPFVRGAPTCLKLPTTALMSIGTDENHVYWFELSRVTRMPISAFAARRWSGRRSRAQ